MYENILNPSPKETLRLSGFQAAFSANATQQKPSLISVSSNVYYGYQPLPPQTDVEPMQTDNQCQQPNAPERRDTGYLNRKRCREPDYLSPKKRRQSEISNLTHQPQKYSPTKMNLEEDLLRETHGCSYYHWIAINN